ncbi:MAG TPA: RHS repeat-associated core domain-containing protein [Prosthecobacter sp.]|nr:RHS repeat-associated core domain-containing protein [Prosthecobacter sp.]
MGSLIYQSRDASGLYYRRYRYYDPETGRFVQEDPIGLAGGVNIYGFAEGDPTSFSDPYGLKVCASSPLLRWGIEKAVNATVRWDREGCVADLSAVEFHGGREWSGSQQILAGMVTSESVWLVTRGTPEHPNPLGCGYEGHCSWFDPNTRTTYIFNSDYDLYSPNGRLVRPSAPYRRCGIAG